MFKRNIQHITYIQENCQREKNCPLLIVDINELNRTPLLGLQMRQLVNADDISAVFDEVCSYGIVQHRSTAEFNKRLNDFINNVRKIVMGEYMLYEDEDGYFHTEICQTRNVPEEYRCYKIKGHIEDWKNENSAKSDWLFFHRGIYPELKVGDKVKFKISKKQERDFNDIGHVRNVYPAELIIEN